jgi:predicted ATPase
VSQFETLGKYHVLERLAASRLAEIYKVKTIGIAGFEKVQVLNRILPRYARDAAFLRAFIAEAKIAFSLNHRNIVQVFEFGKMDGELFLATEYIPGVNLEEVLHRCRQSDAQIPIGLACYLMGEVAAGLEYAHRKTDQGGQALDIVHGDLSPYNVGCSWEGSVKVLDFGICRAAWTAADERDRYRGLPRYLAPEQLRGEPLSLAGDIFAFGVMLWELLAGSVLMRGSTIEQVQQRILEAKIPSPRDSNREVPIELDALTLRCLSTDPSRRIGSANELQIELHRIQRQVGAVIGSRALSTFLHEIFPDHAETRDVRQQGFGAAPPEPPSRDREPEPIDALVAAAAELAQPHNPPAEAVRDRRRRRRRPTGDGRTSAEALARQASQEARVAGVLRSTRHLDEDLTVGPPKRRRKRGTRDLEAISSDEVTAGPITVEQPSVSAQTPAFGVRQVSGGLAPDARPAPGRHTEEFSAHELEHIIAADDPLLEPGLDHKLDDQLDDFDQPLVTAGSPTLDDSAFSAAEAELDSPPRQVTEAEVTLDASQLIAEEDDLPSATVGDEDYAADVDAAVAVLADDDPWRTQEATPPTEGERFAREGAPSEEHRARAADVVVEPAISVDQARPSATMLGEKKRFIAVATIIEGAADGCGEALQLVEDIAYKLEGLIHQRDRRRLVALFGLPMTDENDIVSAVRFARDAQEAIGHLSNASIDSSSEDPIGIRLGIRVGTARMRTAPSREGYQVFGNTIDETVALAEHAAEGQTYVAGAAARLASMHYVLRQVEAVRRYGKPVRCYRVIGPQPAEQRRHDSGEPLIGREMELNALRSAWRETVLGGEQRAVLIVGDAGLGKSRLVDEFLLRHGSDATVLSAAATPHRREQPHALLLDLLRGATGIAGTSSQRSRRRLLERLEQLLAPVPAAQREDILDTVESLLDPQAPPLGESAESRRSRLHAALRGLFDGLARQRPLVVVVEDLHWADSSSCEVIASLINQPELAAAAIFVLATMRPSETGEVDDLFVEGIVSHVVLEELDPGDRQRLIMECLGDESVGNELMAEIERRAGGNPFYIRELTEAARELDVSSFAAIPDSVRGVLQSRVDRLPSQVKIVLQHAASIGPVFREGILTRLLSRNPARSLAELRNRGILVPGVNMAVRYTAGSEQFEREWAFRHVLVQQVIYESLASGDRRELHRKVGEIMSRRAARGSSDPPAEVARHLELAGQLAEAADYYLRAAEEAAIGYANKEAGKLYDRAVALLADEGDEERRYRAHAGRERVLGRLGLHDRQAQDLSTLRQLGADDPSRLADLRSREALRLLRVGEIYRALEAAEQAEQAAVEAADDLLRGEALRLRGEAYERLDDHTRALNTVRQALEIFEQEQAIPHQVRARIGLGRVLLAQARYDEALEQYDPALALIKQTEDRWHERVLRNNTAVVHLCRGDFARALDDAMYSLKLCVEFGDLAREGDNATVIGIVYLELGMHEQAQRYLHEALAIHAETGSRWSEADTLTYAGLLANAFGDRETALSLLQQARSLAQQLNARFIEINALSGMALVHCDRGSGDDAQRGFELATEAYERARPLGLIVGEIPGLSRAARASAQLGELDTARGLSRRAVELLDEQRHIDGPEEEIYYTHYRILRAAEQDGAALLLERAHAGVSEKLARIADAAQRESFERAVPLNAAILRDVSRGGG